MFLKKYCKLSREIRQSTINGPVQIDKKKKEEEKLMFCDVKSIPSKKNTSPTNT